MSEWDDRARLALARNGVGRELADTVLDEVEQHCSESGEEPETAFGTPEEFAVSVAVERVPAAERAERDRDGMTARSRRRVLIILLGVQVLVLCLVLWLEVGLMVPLTLAGSVGAVLGIAAAAGAMVTGFELRPSGRPRAVVWAFAGVGVLVVLAALAFTTLPKTPIGSLPVPVVAALGILVVWWGSRYEPRALNTGASDWEKRLAGLLEGRHDIPRRRAAELAAEAGQHLAASGNTAEEEFGPAEEYAAELAGHEPARPPWWRSGRAQNALMAALLLSAVVFDVADEDTTWMCLALSLLFAIAALPPRVRS
ncbi:hypothetical protein [Allokutzneria sp. NRRL B-24872]|uniref:hypothetical protein n=1 Tax=Allokutzneria sp. NRRL B-24872 TaxID=1137961 RepID=UPI000A370CA9|nr:hypothetical protein [Allokutzneria sp. NRRL B-24872]